MITKLAEGIKPLSISRTSIKLLDVWIQILNCDYSRFTFLLLIKSLFHNYLFKADQRSQRRFEPLYQFFRRNSFGFLNLFSICL